MVTTMKPTKLAIPHPYEKNCAIAGILQQLAPDEHTLGRKLTLILHGSRGHKDYLYQKPLAHRLPMDSFRFDFRGNHETPGPWHFGSLDNDIQDLEVVVEYLTRQYGYVIDLLVGHSRGSVVSMLWLCKHRDGLAKDVRRFVNVSGRYRMKKIYEEMEAHRTELDSQGFVLLTSTAARKPFVARITRADYDTFARNDNSIVWGQFPAHIDVLTIHGLKDTVAPPYDAFIYARAYGARSPGTHTLHYIEEADHNFTGVREEVVSTVLEWLKQHDRKELRTGVWHTGVKGKL